MSEPIDDGSDKPLGYTTEDGELEVKASEDGSRGYQETELGRHQRWMRQAPDLYERYQALLFKCQRPEAVEAYHVEPDQEGGDWHSLTFADGRQVKIFTDCPLVVVDPETH